MGFKGFNVSLILLHIGGHDFDQPNGPGDSAGARFPWSDSVFKQMFIDAFFETPDIFVGSFEPASQFLDFVGKMLLIVALVDLVDQREVSIMMIGMDLRVGVEVHMVVDVLNGAFVQNVPGIASLIVTG